MEPKNVTKTRPGAKAAASMAAGSVVTGSAGTQIGDDISGMGFERAMQELETVVQRLEGGELALADSLAAYQRGAALMRHAQAMLDHVQSEIDIIESAQEKQVDRATLISQIKD